MLAVPRRGKRKRLEKEFANNTASYGVDATSLLHRRWADDVTEPARALAPRKRAIRRRFQPSAIPTLKSSRFLRVPGNAEALAGSPEEDRRSCARANAFGYDDVCEQSSVGITKNPTKLVLTVHPLAS
jgi:hypothetical protein